MLPLSSPALPLSTNLWRREIQCCSNELRSCWSTRYEANFTRPRRSFGVVMTALYTNASLQSCWCIVIMHVFRRAKYPVHCGIWPRCAERGLQRKAQKASGLCSCKTLKIISASRRKTGPRNGTINLKLAIGMWVVMVQMGARAVQTCGRMKSGWTLASVTNPHAGHMHEHSAIESRPSHIENLSLKDSKSKLPTSGMPDIFCECWPYCHGLSIIFPQKLWPVARREL